MTTRKEYFILALKAELFRKRAWVFSVFSMTKEDENSTLTYPFMVKKVGKNYAYVDPNSGELVAITDSDSSKPLFYHKDRITVTKDDVPNVRETVDTTYGNVFFNYTSLVYPFGNKLPFVTGRVNAGTIESTIATMLTDNPENDSERTQDKIYVDEYIKFGDAMFYLGSFTQLWVPAATEKTMTCHPDTPKVKAALLEKYKDQLHDPAIVAKIEAELVAFDKENWLKGDASEGFLISKKATDVVRKKMFLMYGAEQGFNQGFSVDPITNSLNEGWDIEKFPTLNNALRAGSFNRGAETMLGGESVKWLLRASSNMAIVKEDCGTKLGISLLVSENNYKQLISRYIVMGTESVLVTEETAKSYVGKLVVIRSPMFCKLDKTDFCNKCVGDRLSTHPTGLSIAVSNYGSAFLYLFMSAMHGKKLETARLNIETSLT